jgi:D-alanine-D-alanine ligase-like ATP-grasp enzyme
VERAARKRLGFEKTIYVDSRVEEYRDFWAGAAQKLGAEFRTLGYALWEVSKNGKHTRIYNAGVELNNSVVSAVCSDKVYTHTLAKELGVPVPRGKVFRLEALADAKNWMSERKGLYVVKPARQTSAGIGVSTQVRTPKEMEKAALLASLFQEEFILEEMVPGETCRLLYLQGKLLHAVRRRGVRVYGDGQCTLAELASAVGFPKPMWDLNAEWTLSSQGRKWTDVPDAGNEVLLRSLPLGENKHRELRTVYTEEITRDVCPGLREECERMVRALEADLAGVDIVTVNPRLSLTESGGVLLEVNPGPGIHHNYISEEDRREHRVATAILRSLLEEG